MGKSVPETFGSTRTLYRGLGETGGMRFQNDPRRQHRRADRATAERVDLAALTARAFDLHAAKNYLRLSGVQHDLIESFAARYPQGLRAAQPERIDERRRPAAAG